MSVYLGDIVKGGKVQVKPDFTNKNGASTNPTNHGTVHVYRGNELLNETQVGVVYTNAPVDGLAGHAMVEVTTSDVFYTEGQNYSIVLKGAVIDGETVNKTIGYFSIENRASNVTHWSGTAVPTPHTAGYPIVTIKDGTGTGEIDTNNGVVPANVTFWQGVPPAVLIGANVPANAQVVADKTGYSISGSKTTLDDLQDLSAAQSKAQADQALIDIHLDHLIAVDTPTMPGNAGAILPEMLQQSGTSKWQYTVEALELAPSGGGGGLTEQQVRDAMKLAPSAGAPAAGSVDTHLDDIQAQTDTLQFDGSNNILSSPQTLAQANISQIDDSADSAKQLGPSARGLITFVVGTGSTTSSIVLSSSNPTMVDVDQFKGQNVKFEMGTTTPGLRGQGATIQTGSVVNTLQLAAGALTQAPAAGDVGTIA